MAANCYLIDTLDGGQIYLASCESVQDALNRLASLSISNNNVANIFSLQFNSETDSTVSSCFDIDNQSTARIYTSIRNKLITMEKPQHGISMLYRETMRAMISKFSDLVYIDGKNEVKDIKCYHGNPERAVAKYFQENNIVLPAITISQTSTETDTTRSRYHAMLLQEKYWNPDTQRAIRILSFAPTPVNIIYSINVWSKYKIDMDQILEQIRLIFNPSSEIETPFSTLTKAFLIDEEDNSEVDVGDGSDRVLKKSLSIEVQTYIPNPKYLITSTGRIERFNIESVICEN